MHSRLFTIALFATGAFAVQNWQKVETSTVHALRDLRIRQGESFIPGTSDGFGETCAEAFGAGHIECATSGICYNPDEGQICCDAGYPCPAKSVCIGNGKCCPEGLDIETCAKEAGVPVPSSSAAPEPEPTSYPVPSSSAGGVVTMTTTVCETTKGYPTATGVAPTGGYPSPTGSFTPPPPFEGAASFNGIATGTVALAALLAAVNLL